ncbi:hypothetical protein NQ315_005822 [Exocentrus adspersus]|uniref:Uncharacterized protein n=1 Tax=Exocentrus adspersus TaxID=1586481 RepID=A0AAV8VRR3_9CUCU|nr:hypothetical protein NQ315_005822 [Exocentrus adspersus]
MENTKREHPPFFKSVRNYFREYCTYSSIHGFRYFGEKRTYFERGWWFIVFAVTLAGCAIAIREVYKKWITSPVIVSFATRETPIYSIPFPAVTICPEAKTKQDLYNHTHILRKFMNDTALDEREQKLYNYMSLICNPPEFIFPISDNSASGEDTFDEDFFKELHNISYINPFLSCSYMGNNRDCSHSFKPIITDEGICFTFNMLDRSEIYKDNTVQFRDYLTMDDLTYENWSMSNGYSPNSGVYPYPRRALLAGAKNSLNVHLLTQKSDIDHTCKHSLQGFRVLLHTPMRIPRPSVQYFWVPINQVVLGAIQPVMINSSESVGMYNPKRRECYFPKEKELKFFKIYTSLNCKLECLTNFTLHQCGCVNFYMPRDNSTSICGNGKSRCMKKAEQLLQMGDLRKKIELSENKSTNGNNTKNKEFYRDLLDCDCMPLCNDLSYDVEISQNDWDWLDALRSLSPNGTLSFKEDDYHLSSLTLFFKSSQFITSQRHELYGPTDFLANFGGLLGLFTGFSILSLMEAIYFLTVRLCCNSRLYGYWAGPDT